MFYREHRRARLRLPVRLRWTAPFGQKIELCETVDASRSGLLVSCKEPHTAGVILWVTFPYDASLADSQPEISARVMRCSAQEVRPFNNASPANRMTTAAAAAHAAKLNELTRALHLLDEPKIQVVALHFEESPHSSNGHGQVKESERRCSPRRLLALPVRVRLEHMPWFEEAMTVDVSEGGMRLRSNREYEPGAHLFASFDPCGYSPWPNHGEFRSLVLRVEPMPDTSALSIAVCRLQ